MAPAFFVPLMDTGQMDKKAKIDSKPQAFTPYGCCQPMPKQRVRLDPTCVMSFAVWIIAYAQHWEREVKRPLVDLPNEEKAALEARRKWYKNALSALQCLLSSLTDTVHVADFELAKRELEAAIEKTREPGFDPLNYAQMQTPPQPQG